MLYAMQSSMGFCHYQQLHNHGFVEGSLHNLENVEHIINRTKRWYRSCRKCEHHLIVRICFRHFRFGKKTHFLEMWLETQESVSLQHFNANYLHSYTRLKYAGVLSKSAAYFKVLAHLFLPTASKTLGHKRLSTITKALQACKKFPVIMRRNWTRTRSHI